MNGGLQKIINEHEDKRLNSILAESNKYIKEVIDFLISNKDMPRNPKDREFGISNRSHPHQWTKRSVKVSNSGGQSRPFTHAFAQFCLQVARNLAPYQTGNLRDNIQVSWNYKRIEILFNAKGTATYTTFLDKGYPNAKWMGFIQNIRDVITMLTALYQSYDEEDEAKLQQAMRTLGRGGRFMRNVAQLRSEDKITQAGKVVLKRAKITGWERKKLPTSAKTITPQDRATLSKRSDIRQVSAREKRMIDTYANIVGIEYKQQKQGRSSSSKTRGG